jgi:hypothetical protein
MPSPPNIYVANDFYHDCVDLLQRYKLTIDQFYSVRSKRLKTFIDLRIASECVLKAYIAYFSLKDLDRETVINKVESYKHHIGRMAEEVVKYVTGENWTRFLPFVQQLDALPVGLRYRIDVFDFRKIKEEFYYQTVGSDDWLNNLHDALKAISDELNLQLNYHSKIISGAELRGKLLESQHNKYSKKNKGVINEPKSYP